MKYIDFPELSRLAQALTYDGPECAVHTRIEAYSCKNIKRDKKLFKALEHAYTDELSNSPPAHTWLASSPGTVAANMGSSSGGNAHPHAPVAPELDDPSTPFGPLTNPAARKVLYLLIATLNIAFPDHEFSDVRPAHFSREPGGAGVLAALSAALAAPTRARMHSYSAYPPPAPGVFPTSVPTSSSSAGSSGYVDPAYAASSSRGVPSGLAHAQTHPALYRLVDAAIGLNDSEVFAYAPDIDSDPHANDFSDDEDDVASVGDEDAGDDDDDDEGEDSADAEEPSFKFEEEERKGEGLNSSTDGPMRRPKQSRQAQRLRGQSRKISTSRRSSASSPNPSPERPPPRSKSNSKSKSRTSSKPINTTRTTSIAIRPSPSSSLSSSPSIYSSYSHPRPYRHIRMKRRGALLWSSHWFFLNRKLKRILFVSVWARTRTRGDGWGTGDEEAGEYGYGEPHSYGSSYKERFFGWEGGAGAGARAMGIAASI